MGGGPIGLVAGLGPAATLLYYRRLVDGSAARGAELRLFINHADVGRVLAWADAGLDHPLAAYLADRCAELERAGARVLAVGAVTPHAVFPALARGTRAPLVDLVAAAAAELRRRSIRKVAALGTRRVVESRLFGRLPAVAPPPDAAATARVHDLYASVVRTGTADRATGRELAALGGELVLATGSDALLLAGTELSLFPAETWGDLPVVDCVEAHVQAILDAAQGT